MAINTYHYREHPAERPGVPLLFLFHGTGGNESQFFDFGHQLLPAASIVSLRGDVSEQGALRFFRRTGEGVYDMDDLAQRTAAMKSFVKAHIKAASPSATIGLGYSNGANILASTMLDDPSLFDAAVLMHPLIPWQPESKANYKDKKILMTAGENDAICPAPLTQGLADYFTRQGGNVTLQWHPGGHEIRQEEISAIQDFLQPYK
ncbi:MAG: alpha/beta hydrolase [Phyllobacterium sp.]